MGFLSGLLGGGKTSTSFSNKQVSTPYGPALPALQQVGNLATQVAQSPLQFHGGYTPMDPRSREALAAQETYAGQLGDQAINPAFNSWMQTLNPQGVADNPYMRAAMGALTDQFTQDMNLGVLPGLRSRARAGGNTRSTRSDISEGVATGLGLQGLSRAQAGLAYQGFGDALGQQRFGLGMLPQMLQAGQMPHEMLYGVGQAYQAEDERARALEQARREFAQDEPLTRGTRALGLAGTLGQLGGKVKGSGTQTTQQPGGGLGSLLGLGLTAASFFGGGPAALGGLSGGLGPMTQGIGYSPVLGAYARPDLMGGPFPGQYTR